MKKYKHIFFDLDRTLWDFEQNSRQALEEIFEKYKLHLSISFEDFLSFYKKLNNELWELYSQEKITKESLRFQRFYKSLTHFGVEEYSLIHWVANDYVNLSSTKNNVLPHTHELLEYLLEKKYALHIITNGFEEVQYVKLKNCKLEKYFTEIITSERAGYKKPDKRIFDFSLEITQAQAHEAIMIGDNYKADIQGAKNANMAHVFFNPELEVHSHEVMHEISSLIELKQIL